ncbi:MAG: SGNH/GDSL hydrolase family protein [Pseudomonadales bacterium]
MSLVLALINHPMIGGGTAFGATQLLLVVASAALFVAGLLGSKVQIQASLGAVSVILSVLVAEGALRICCYDRFSTAYRLHEKYLYELIPRASQSFTHIPVNGGHRVTFSVNVHGFRGPDFELPRSKHDPAKRVVVYGDSFVHATFSDNESTFVSRLGYYLQRELGSTVEPINAGVAGYGPDQILLRMERELRFLEPDLVVVAVFSGNDFGDLVRNKLFKLNAQEQLMSNEFEVDPEIRRQFIVAQTELFAKKLVREAVQSLPTSVSGRRTQVASFNKEEMVSRALNQHLREYKEYLLDGDDVVKEMRMDPYSADIAVMPESESAQYKVALMQSVMRGITATADRSGVPILYVTIPHPMDVLDGDHDSGFVDRAQFPDYDADRLSRLSRGLAESTGARSISLIEKFRLSDPWSLYFKGGDDHWNDTGQDVAAQYVAEVVLSEGLL